MVCFVHQSDYFKLLNQRNICYKHPLFEGNQVFGTPIFFQQQLTDLSRACSSRGRHNLRQFQNWLTDNNEKLERMKSNMLKRHTHESHALRAAQALEWSFKLRHIQPPLPAAVAEELSEANFVPRVDLVKEVMVPF